MLVKLHKNKGITLIALIITIIVLLILAGVAVNMLVGEDGILSHTKTSTDKYSIESEKEALKLEILNIQTEILKTEGRKATLEDLQARIDLEKYEIEMHYEPIATSTPVATPATYVIVKRIGTDYYFTVDNTLIITKVEEIKEEDSPISKFTISLSDTTYKDTTVTLNEIPTSEAGTIEKYDYVAQTTDNKIEIPNITETTKKITGLTEKTAYKVYVIAYDNAGNKRKSNIVTITTPEYTPPDIKITNISPGKVLGHEVALPFNWSQLVEISKVIANNSSITSNTAELTIKYEETTYTIGVGDYTYINGKKVRILGFNHDELVDKTSYNNSDGTENTYAGMSFEYVDFITSNLPMTADGTNSGGWGSENCILRTTLNEDLYDEVKKIIGENAIKRVKKAYCIYNNSKLLYSKDYLWLLSCAEIWINGTNGNHSGYSPGFEGKRYRYYAIINAIYNYDNNYLRKPSNAPFSEWWLRSSFGGNNIFECTVNNTGQSGCVKVSDTCAVAPGFCI